VAANQRKPYCVSVNRHSHVGLVSRQGDTVDWAGVLFDRCIRKSLPYQRRFWFWEKPEVAGGSLGRLTDLVDVMLCQNQNPHESCRMGRCSVLMKLICCLGHCECDSHTVHKFSWRRLTADWLTPRDSDCLRMHSKVSSDWLPSYIKNMWRVLEIFKMSRYFPESPR